MNLLIIISSLFLIFYVIQIILYIFGFLKLKEFIIHQDKFKFENKKYLSVIIPFKNEKKNLPDLIKSLRNQTLNSNYFELFFINDHSEDNSEQIVKKLIKDIPNFYLISEDSTAGGKKNALQTGLSAASTNIIVTTDADCSHNKKWLETILNYYIKYKPKMIIAPVLMKGKSFFENMQSLEFLSLIASTAGAAGTGHPIMNNGANSVYEKKVYKEFEDALNMKEESGDDIFLLHNIKKKYPKEIHFLKSNDAVVYTKAEKSLKSFFRQRVRWASKSSSYKDFDSIICSFIVLGINLILIILFVMSIFETAFLKPALVLMILKIIPDLILIILSAGYFKINKLIMYFPVTVIIYPVYIVITGVAGLFIRKFSWK